MLTTKTPQNEAVEGLNPVGLFSLLFLFSLLCCLEQVARGGTLLTFLKEILGVAKHNGQKTCFRTQLPWVGFQAFPKKSSEKKFGHVAEVNQRCCLEESGQWHESVDGTHLVLVTGKLVLQKKYILSNGSYGKIGFGKKQDQGTSWLKGSVRTSHPTAPGLNLGNLLIFQASCDRGLNQSEQKCLTVPKDKPRN